MTKKTRHLEEIESFDHVDLYDELMNRPYTRRLKEEVRYSLSALDIKDARILEVGAGKSEFAQLFDLSNTIVLTDLNLLLLGENNGSCYYRVLCDGESPPFIDSSFDLIIFIGILHHIIDQRNALICAKRLLSENGRILICEPHRRSLNFFYYMGRKLFLKLFGEDRVREMIGCFSPNEVQLDCRAVKEVFGKDYNVKFRSFLTARLPPFRFFKNSTLDVRLSSILDRIPLINNLGTTVIVEVTPR